MTDDQRDGQTRCRKDRAMLRVARVKKQEETNRVNTRGVGDHRRSCIYSQQLFLIQNGNACISSIAGIHINII